MNSRSIVRIQRELGNIALRIDHIGSTAVPGLAAKPIIDIQISVASFERFPLLEQALNRAGFLFRRDNPDRTKRYFRELPSEKRTRIHVRVAGSLSQQLALLFRDYLRASSADRDWYASEKIRLAKEYRSSRDGYTSAKEPVIWEIFRRANSWSQSTEWSAFVGDARD